MARTPAETDQLALAFFRRYLAERGVPPTVAEVGRGIGLSQPQNAQRSLDRLVAAGELVRAPRVGDRRASRGYRLAAGRPVLSIPARGEVSCGPPREGGNDDEQLDLSDLVRRDDLVTYTAAGDSMREAAILPGDRLVVREHPDPENGQTVVAVVGSEMVCKRYYRKGGRVRLEPCSGAHQPLDVDPARTPFRVLGVLHTVIRRV